MRDWFKRWEKVIVIIVAVFFTAGIAWWSVASYVTARKAATNTQINKPSKDLATAIMTKAGTELDYPYWIMNYEVSADFDRISKNYENYGQKLDPIFDVPLVKASIVEDLYNFKIKMYYADENGILPSKKELEKEFKKFLDDVINKYKANKEQWDKIMQNYGNEENLRNFITNNYKDLYIRQKIEQVVFDKVATATDSEIMDYVKNNFEDIKTKYEEVKAKHILVSDEATANKILNMIKNGEITFSQAASEFSLDTSNATAGGELGWFKRGSMVKEFEDASFNATIGELMGPVKTSYGYHIIEVEDKKVFNKPEDVLKYKDVYDQIVKDYQNKKYKEWFDKYKKDEKFGLIFENDMIERFYKYRFNSNDLNVLNSLKKELEDLIFDENGEISIDAYSEDLALYVMITGQIQHSLESSQTELSRYISLSEKVPKEYLNLPKDEINKKIEELDKLIEKASEEEQSKLYSQKFDYMDTLDLMDLKEKMKDEGIDSVEKAKAEKKKIEGELNSLKEKRLKVLHELYLEYPESMRVLSEYHQADPTNLEVGIRYSKKRFELIKKYFNYVQDTQLITSYFGRTIMEIKLTLDIAVNSSKVSTDLKLEALETLIDLSDVLKDYRSKLDYLEEMKKLDPKYYPDIDDLISQTQKLLEEESKKATETTTSTSTTK